MQIGRRSRRLRRLQPLEKTIIKGNSFKNVDPKKSDFQMFQLNAISDDIDFKFGFSAQNNVDQLNAISDECDFKIVFSV